MNSNHSWSIETMPHKLTEMMKLEQIPVEIDSTLLIMELLMEMILGTYLLMMLTPRSILELMTMMISTIPLVIQLI